ncbi:MAG: hypothetical protein ACKVWV_04510 [Planctomycetota bacterium]
MPTIADLLLGILAPALVCGIVGVAVWSKPSKVASALTGLAVAAGIGIAYVAVSGAPVLPGANRRLAAIEWLPWIVAISWILATIADARSPLARRYALPLVLVSLVLGRSFANRMQPAIPWGELLTIGGPMLVAWWAAARLAERDDGPSLPAAWTVSVSAFSIAALLTHSAKVAQIAGGVAACLGALAVAGFARPSLSLASVPAAVVLAALASLTINATVFSDLPQSAALLVALSLVAPSFAKIGSETRTLPRVIVHMTFALVPALVALYFAYRAAPESYR